MSLATKSQKIHAKSIQRTRNETSKYKPAVGKYLTMGPRDNAGRDCPCNNSKSLTSAFSSKRDDCGWDRMETFE